MHSKKKMFLFCLVLLLCLPILSGLACSNSSPSTCIGDAAACMKLADQPKSAGTSCGLLGALNGECK